MGFPKYLSGTCCALTGFHELLLSPQQHPPSFFGLLSYLVTFSLSSSSLGAMLSQQSLSPWTKKCLIKPFEVGGKGVPIPLTLL